jgi:predicted PurR-regulated permease PerM
MMLDQADSALRDAGIPRSLARWASVGLFIILGVLLALIFVSFVRLGLSRLPILLDRLLPRIDTLFGRLGVNLPIDNVQELRQLILDTLKENSRSVTAASGLLTRGFFQIIVCIAVALLAFLWIPITVPHKQGLDEDLLRHCSHRLTLFTASFVRVMGAQVLIAAINTAVTSIFLFAFHIPFRTLLTLTTFVCGMIPIAGNVLSNTLIVASALTVSDKMALFALIFLVVIHKAEYFLNSHIIGSRISTPMWATLLGLLIGEALMGFTGAILAPTMIYYVREELRQLPVHRD